ncbi:SET domain-containing protein 4 [Parasteatoda tepidariorum]|uniref:SET domain-containing protein 4 n=1 Tax=Parasteatoda tepidariorum TaxID=114398 RepID=UPI001C725326|nr:SET domain-containing protein 4 [Parasteatoda tepidariorum]XP_042906230.1 SET domain-containing protein 4 [Parasteatoda tepidariorum]
MTNNSGRTYRKRRRKLNPSCNANLNIHDQKYFNLLCHWMGTKGFKPLKRLCPMIFKESGRGLMAKERISGGDVIVAIPEKLLITPVKVLSLYLGDYFEKYCPDASGHEILSVFLMYERVKFHSSEWYPYLCSLPESYDIPAFHDGYPISKLPINISSLATKQMESVKTAYEKLNLLLKHLEQSHPIFHNTLNFSLYKWAWCTVNTRCVHMDCFRENCPGKFCTFHLALAPYLDLLNHNCEVQVVAGYNSERRQYEIRSLCGFKKYSQVFINYGPHNNYTLLIEYGFIVNQNHNHSVTFSSEEILDACKQCHFISSVSEKLKFILSNDILSNAVCSHDGLSWNLVVILRILTSENQLKDWKSILHDGSKLSADELNYETLKKNLLSIKINDYNFVYDTNSVAYSYLEKIIEELSSIDKLLLIKALK